MSKKEELSEQYRREVYEVSPTRKRCQHNNEVIAWNNEIVGAFESGYDAGKQENEHLVWQISEANFEKGKEIGKKEIIDKACEWLEDNLVQCWIADFLYVQFKHREHQEKENVLADFRKAMGG